MDAFVLALIIAVVVALRVWSLPKRLQELQDELKTHKAEHQKQQAELKTEMLSLREQLASLLKEGTLLKEPPSVVSLARPGAVATSASVLTPASEVKVVTVPSPDSKPITPVPVAVPITSAPAPVRPAVAEPVVTVSVPPPAPVQSPVLPVATAPAVAAAPTPAPTPAPVAIPPVPVPAPALQAPPVSAPVPPPVFNPAPVAVPAPIQEARPTFDPRPVAAPDSVLATAPTPSPSPLVPPTPPQPPRRPPPPPEPTGPTWWERASTLILENWTGILGAVVLVTGVGFLGIYAALRVSPPLRFLLICAFAAGLLGVRFALRQKGFARQLNSWLLSCAAAIFLFACVAAVSIEGLRWATAPWDYLLLLAGVGANLLLAWRAPHEEVATLHGVLSLVALAVLPPTILTLGTAAAVTAFTIAITYRQRWKYQLLLSIASFFAFHLYWHQQLTDIPHSLRLMAMGLVGLVGVAAAVVQYRSVYAQRRFEPLLFTAHLLNWTCLGINLYMYSTGSIWKTIPLGLGALLTFWAGRHAKKLGIGWLFQTDTIISLILALATALSLQGWHATNSVILLFMLLELLLVALVMARQREALVYRVALSGACLAGGGLLLLAGFTADSSLPQALYREAFVLALSGWAGLAFSRLMYKQPLLRVDAADAKAWFGADAPAESARNLLACFAGLAGLLQAGAGLLLTWVLFSWTHAPVIQLVGILLALSGCALALAAWVRTASQTPDWVRQQQLLLAQLFAVLACLGLHELGLSWPVVLGILYAENVALLAARRREPLLSHIAQAGAFLAGGGLLLTTWAKVGNALPHELYRDALVLALTGWLSLAFLRLAYRQLSAPVSSDAPTEIPETDQRLLSGFAGLAALLQASTGLLLARVLFGWQNAPVTLLLAALLVMGGVALGLAAWVRAEPRLPAWVRPLQLLLAQSFAMLAVFGLHETGLSWPVVMGLLLAENLAVALLAARKREVFIYRVALGGTFIAGLNLLLLAWTKVHSGLPRELYRDALLLALAGWACLAFLHLVYRQLLSTASAESEAEISVTDHHLLSGFAGLAGLLQASTGLLLARVLFGWQDAPVLILLAALLGIGGMALGLAAWLRTETRLPAWVRQQQLLLAQSFAMLTVFGLHELNLSWPVVLGLLFTENLAVVLIAARKREVVLYHFALSGAFIWGLGMLLNAVSKVGQCLPRELYREALVLALAGWTGIIFVKLTLRQLLPARHAETPDIRKTDRDLLGGMAGLAGLLQAGTGLLLARVLFGWQSAPVAILLATLLGMSGVALGLATWVRTQSPLPRWVRRQQLVLGQVFAVLAVFGLHEVGLSWPGVLLVLYAESLVVALLLNARDEDDLLHLQTYLLVLQAALLPLLVRYATPEALGPLARAAILAGAALLTVGYQLRRYLPKATEDFAVFPLGPTLRLPVLGLAVGWLLLHAGSLVYERSWAGWAMVGLLGGLLYLRHKVTVTGLWAGLLMAAIGYLALQWNHVLWPPSGALTSAGAVLLYLLPTLAVPAVGTWVSWWPQGERFVRWPWVYLLGVHLVVALVAAVPTGHTAYLSLGFTGLAGAAFAAAQVWRRILPNEPAVQRAGQPDRYLLHLGYGLLTASLLTHVRLLVLDERFFGQPAEYVTAALLFATLAALALAAPPATAPVYKSWRWLHPRLPEAALLFGTATLGHHVRTPWLPLLWAGAALVLTFLAARIPVRFRRMAMYGHLYYWLATGTASLACLRYIRPEQLLSPEWWGITAAVALLFGYVALALQAKNTPDAGLSPALARLPRRALEAWLLYPAFLALTLLLVQSFDRSVLTVLLMLEVVAVFITSLLLRRQDLRYLALAGMLGALLRLVFFDLSRSGTITRAFVFIFMGLLLLGMNALYARFKARFTPEDSVADDVSPDKLPEPDVQVG